MKFKKVSTETIAPAVINTLTQFSTKTEYMEKTQIILYGNKEKNKNKLLKCDLSMNFCLFPAQT